VTITATFNGVSASGTFTVLPTALKSAQVTPVAVSGGSPVTAWVDLDGPAPAGGARLSLSSDSPAVSGPAAFNGPPGAWAASAPGAAAGVGGATLGTIPVTFNGVSKQARMTVGAPRAPDTLRIDPISRIGSDPGSATGRVTIASFSAY